MRSWRWLYVVFEVSLSPRNLQPMNEMKRAKEETKHRDHYSLSVGDAAKHRKALHKESMSPLKFVVNVEGLHVLTN